MMGKLAILWSKTKQYEWISFDTMLTSYCIDAVKELFQREVVCYVNAVLKAFPFLRLAVYQITAVFYTVWEPLKTAIWNANIM